MPTWPEVAERTSAIESGARNPTITILQRLSDALGISAAAFAKRGAASPMPLPMADEAPGRRSRNSA